MKWEDFCFAFGDGTTHERVVRHICRKYSALTMEFRKKVLAAIEDSCDPEVKGEGCSADITDEIETSYKFRFVPDVYKVIKEENLVILWEIEDSNPLSRRKIKELSEFIFELDYWEWKVKLILVDRYGNENQAHIVATPKGFQILSDESYKEFLVQLDEIERKNTRRNLTDEQLINLL